MARGKSTRASNLTKSIGARESEGQSKAKARVKAPGSTRRTKRRQDGNGARERSDLTRESPLPLLDATLAYRFVQLLHAGLPIRKALGYLEPTCSDTQLDRLAATWPNDTLVFQATLAFTRGEWPTLDKDARLTLARDKYLAELAYFLYTRSFSEAGDDLGRVKYAFAVIHEYLVSQGSGDTNPMRDFLTDLAKGEADEGPHPVMPAGDTLVDAKKAMN